MMLPFSARVIAVLGGGALTLTNVWLWLLGFAPFVGRQSWIIFAGGILITLAGLYGGAGYYPPRQKAT